MSLMSCSACGGQVSKEAYACPKCGQPTPAAKAQYQQFQLNHMSSTGKKWGVAIPLVLIVFITVERFFPELVTKFFAALGL